MMEPGQLGRTKNMRDPAFPLRNGMFCRVLHIFPPGTAFVCEQHKMVHGIAGEWGYLIRVYGMDGPLQDNSWAVAIDKVEPLPPPERESLGEKYNIKLCKTETAYGREPQDQ